ncbi:unnamed protein product [Coffea canephora]|uniref:Uncharacterized protein n=1 Tax=Coffea canephora TaxID=49390 RepID=A0A068U608_COFCA|nr:unnamed protein product [Coffea canephora]
MCLHGLKEVRNRKAGFLPPCVCVSVILFSNIIDWGSSFQFSFLMRGYLRIHAVWFSRGETCK